MYDHQTLIGAAAVLALAVAPLALGLQGSRSVHRTPLSAGPAPASLWDWKLTITSALLFALAFNLIFFIQELFLALPKALTPGLRPILFHNNHTWTGESPLLKRRVSRSSSARLFLIWMAFNSVVFKETAPAPCAGC